MARCAQGRALSSSDEARTTGEPEAPRVDGRYELLQRLGKGGMGVVYRARDHASGRVIALKQLRVPETSSKQLQRVALFEREYHTLVRLKHPRIIEVYDYGVADSRPYYTMELLEGGDLQQLAPMPVRDVCIHLRDIASSLALLHAHRLLHRDISPRNIRFTSDGRAKLIDFGALTAFGRAADVVGTPACIAPEVLRRMPLDQRADLFALGTVAYYALTGRHAYPMRALEELPLLWKRGVIPPSALKPEIPAALDSLILSLTSEDWLSRPVHAAQVIDQLSAIAQLEAVEPDLAAESYLASGRMVGRDHEADVLRRQISNTVAGKGGEFVLEGKAGFGKTRFLHEIALDAQLRGLVVLKADAEACSGQFGAATELALHLLSCVPELGPELARPHAEVLSWLSPELRSALAPAAPLPSLANPAELRVRMQTALYEWFSELARRRPMLIAVDNLQAADDASASFLAALGHEARSSPLLLLATLRTGDRVQAPQAVRALRARSGQLELAALSAKACEQLVQSLFGDVNNSGRIAKLLYEKSTGNPQHCMDLAQLLVRKQIAKYMAGTWILPFAVSSAELPGRIDEILASKLEALGSHALALAEALSIQNKPISIERCFSLVDGPAESEVHVALDQLVSEQVLLLESGHYRFCQEALREALMTGLPAERARALHRRAADAALAGAGEDLGRRMQGGWHLLRAGDELAGADLLASTCRAFLKTKNAREDSQEIVAAMRAALDVFERHGRSEHERAALLFPLVQLCYYSPDFQLMLRYAPIAMRLGLDITGIGLAYHLQRPFGRRLALEVGLRIAGARFARARERGLDYSLPEAIGAFSALVPSSMGVFACCYDTRGAENMGAMAAALSLFPQDRLPAVMHLWSEGQTHLVHGLEGDAHERFLRVRERFDDPKIRQALGEGHYWSLRGGALFVLGLLTCYRASNDAIAIADEIDTLGIRLWAMTATQIRMLHHAFRGESEEAQRYRQSVELFAVQGGTMWQTELYWPAVLINADALCADTIALRRTYEQLERRSHDVPSLRVHADCARAAYLSLRGDHVQAIELYERIVAELVPRVTIAWLPMRGLFAAALNRAGDFARAAQLLNETFEHVRPADREVRMLCFEPRRQLALAHAGLGDRARANEQLRELQDEYFALDNPLLLGLVHEALAQVALASADRGTCLSHLALTDDYYRKTRNPVLIARCRRLADAATRAGLRDALRFSVPEPEPPPHVSSSRTLTMGELAAASDRCDYALRLVIEHVGARAGCLYLLDDDKLRLAAVSGVDEPPEALERALAKQLELVHEDMHTVIDAGGGDESETTRFLSSPVRRPNHNHHVILLTAQRDGVAIGFGGLILELNDGGGSPLDAGLLQAVAEALYEANRSETRH